MANTTRSLAGSELTVLLSNGLEAVTYGHKNNAFAYFKRALSLDSKNEKALVWMAWLTDDIREKVVLLEYTVALYPRNMIARAYLSQARAGNTNTLSPVYF